MVPAWTLRISCMWWIQTVARHTQSVINWMWLIMALRLLFFFFLWQRTETVCGALEIGHLIRAHRRIIYRRMALWFHAHTRFRRRSTFVCLTPPSLFVMWIAHGLWYCSLTSFLSVKIRWKREERCYFRAIISYVVMDEPMMNSYCIMYLYVFAATDGGIWWTLWAIRRSTVSRAAI